MNKLLAMIALLLSLTSCDPCCPSDDEMYDSGYSDGIAAGYDSLCSEFLTPLSGENLYEYDWEYDEAFLKVCIRDSEISKSGQLPTANLLNSGTFSNRALANSELEHQQIIGLSVFPDLFIREFSLLERTLFQVRSGPYITIAGLVAAERILRSNNIPSVRMPVQ
jgi:hypothetical protein